MIIGNTLMVFKALEIIQSEGGERDLHLNITKTELFWPSVDPRYIDAFPSRISRPTKGVKLLGGPVSLDHGYCSDLVKSRDLKTTELMDVVKKLEDPRCKLHLLRSCAGVPKLYFSMLTTMPECLTEARGIFLFSFNLACTSHYHE